MRLAREPVRCSAWLLPSIFVADSQSHKRRDSMDIPSGAESTSQSVPHSHIQTSKDLLELPRFPVFKHESHGPVLNINEVVNEKLSLGQRVADSVANGMGSWRFII